MALWDWLGRAADSGVGAFGALLEWAGGLFGGIADPATRRQVAFSMAVIALSAKMAKADGVVVDVEVAAFEKMFVVPPEEKRHVARLFDLAKRDVAGFESYAAKVAAFYGDDREGLADVLDGLFAIAGADGAVHVAEYDYLERVAEILGLGAAEFERVAARHVVPEEGDPYRVLGVDRSLSLGAIRARYRRLAAENHPDRLFARGLPPEAAAIAHDRMARINRAFERIERERRRS
jgi:DnaJ like chaperone protein